MFHHDQYINLFYIFLAYTFKRFPLLIRVKVSCATAAFILLTRCSFITPPRPPLRSLRMPVCLTINWSLGRHLRGNQSGIDSRSTDPRKIPLKRDGTQLISVQYKFEA